MAVRVPPVMRRIRSATRGRPRLPARLSSRRVRLFAFLGLLGPGLIAANAGNDAGGIATYSSVGAKYGYTLLWTMVLITISLAIVQRLAARMGVVTGKGLAELVREEYGIRWSVFATSAVLIANVGICISDFVGIGAAVGLTGVPVQLSVPIAAVGIWLIIVRGSYRSAERIFIWFTIPFFAYPIAAIVAHPHWGDVGKAIAVPHLHPQHLLHLRGRARAASLRRPLRRGAVRHRPAQPEPARRGDPADCHLLRGLRVARLREGRRAPARGGAGVREHHHRDDPAQRLRGDDPRRAGDLTARRRAGGQRAAAADQPVLHLAPGALAQRDGRAAQPRPARRRGRRHRRRHVDPVARPRCGHDRRALSAGVLRRSPRPLGRPRRAAPRRLRHRGHRAPRRARAAGGSRRTDAAASPRRSAWRRDGRA